MRTTAGCSTSGVNIANIIQKNWFWSIIYISFCYILLHILNYSVLEVWEMGEYCHWWQATNNVGQINLCPIQNPDWVLACFVGESLCQVWKTMHFFSHTVLIVSEGHWSYFLKVCENNLTPALRVCGSYADMNAGTPAEALVDFTGGVHMCVNLREPPPDLWELMTRAGQNNSLMACGTQRGWAFIYHTKP